MRRLAGAVLLLVALVVAVTGPVGLPSGPAGAQEEATAPLTMTLREIDALLAPTDPDLDVSAELLLEAGPHAREDLRLVTTLYTRIEDRAGLRQAVDGDLPSVFSAQSVDLDDLAAGSSRVVRTETARTDLSLQATGREGVYPLQFQVFEGPDPVGSVLTSLIVLPEEALAPLPTTTVLRLMDTGVAPMAGDVAPADLEALISPDAPLQAVSRDLYRLVADGSAAGVTLVPSSRLLADLAAMADGFDRPAAPRAAATDRVARRAGETLHAVRSVARRADTEVLTVPYGPADLVALVRGGLGEQALDLVDIGVHQTRTALDSEVTDTILVPPDGLDADSLAALGPAQAEAVLLESRYLTFAAEEAMEPVRRLRTADGGEVRVLVPDADLSAGLSDPRGEGTAAVIQRLLAETAVQWMAGDGSAPSSTAVLLALDVMQPLPAHVVSRATAAIADAPWLRPVDVSTLAAQVRPADRVVRLAYPPRSAGSELDAGYIDRLRQAHEALIPLRGLLGDEDPAPDRFAQSLTLAPALGFRDPANRAAGDARSAEVLSRLAGLTAAVEVLSSAPITMTATTGEVPVTLINSGDVAVRVRVLLDSSRFEFTDGGDQELTLQPQSAQQLSVGVRALNPGGFAAITVTVQDLDGGVILTRSTISVRSTAFPVVGLIATIGSGVILLVWGVRQSLRRRRRPGRHERTSIDEAGVA